jgi:threonine-phosphate decarboxylase
MSIVHGGNVYEIALRLGCSPDALLDYSASINPLGPPPGLMEELARYFHRVQHYPDISNRALTQDLADLHAVSSSRVAVGNGSTELIYWLPKALNISNAVIALPTFGEYRKAFELEGVNLHKLMTSKENHYQPSVEQLDAVCAEVSPQAILFTHPGSPSGTLLSDDVCEWLLRKSRDDGIYCIVDEVFVDFCEEESLKKYLEDSPRLVLIRSMTKFYGVPGLRLGYLLTSPEVVERVNRHVPAWSVSTLAQIGGSYCLHQEDYRQRTLDVVKSERESLAKRLESLDGCRVYPGEANYLLIELADWLPPAAVLRDAILVSEKIIIRDCLSFEGLNDHFVRVAIRLPEQNRRLSEGIARWVENHSSQRHK